MSIDVARTNQLDDVYDRILARSFRRDVLVDRDTFLAVATWGEVLVSRDEDGALAAAAVADYSPATELVVVEYLAVVPGSRSSGSGTELFTEALDRWRSLMNPGAFLVEIERPDAYPASEAYGDPARRLEFYRRLGVRALALPYYQPALSAEQTAVPDLILGVVVDDPEWVDGSNFIEPRRLADLFAERNPEPSAGEAESWAALLSACDGPVALLDLNDYADIPRSGPIG